MQAATPNPASSNLKLCTKWPISYSLISTDVGDTGFEPRTAVFSGGMLPIESIY